MGKMKKIKTALKIASAFGEVISDESIGKTLFGTYGDGTTRSLADAIDGECISPKDRQKAMKGAKKKKKKHNKKKNKKYDKFYFD